MLKLKSAFWLRVVAVLLIVWCALLWPESLTQATAAGVFVLLLTMPLPEE
jgi:hypothetical protein